MIKELRIQNLVLVSAAKVSLAEGFNVITGETGAGKSAVLAALALVLGAKSDVQLIRKGEVSAYVQITVELQEDHPVFVKLEQWGIPVSERDIVIRRELKKQGKSRAFVNDFSIQLSNLKEIGALLVNFVDQHANLDLLTVQKQRLYLDLYADRAVCYEQFKTKWEQLKSSAQHLNQLRSAQAKRLREIEMLKAQKQEIDAAGIQNGEEAQLFARYSQMNLSEENRVILYNLSTLFSDTLLSAFYQAKRMSGALKGEFAFIENLNSIEKEVSELAYTIEKAFSQLHVNPAELHQINERLSLIHRLHKKYGVVNEYRDQIEKELDALIQIDSTIETLTRECAELQIELDVLAKKLSEQRHAAAKTMARDLEKGLKSLNMPKVKIAIELLAHPRSGEGDESVEFFISPNTGEEQIAVKDCASGGELSRLMLVLQELLAGKGGVNTLIFDEIDANIGGKTANAVGEKLRDIGERCQVICITHFSQVAAKAHRHIQIEKMEEEKRTKTMIQELVGAGLEKELLRMEGKS